MTNITIVLPSGVSTYTLDVAPYYGYQLLINNAVKYDVGYCGDFGAYYTNSHGGWDAFLFEGKCKRIDKIDSNYIDRAFRNQSIEFETSKYLNVVTPTYELTTGWLTDREAERFARNLIPTTTLYLHDLKNNLIFPAVIEEQEAEYKTFRDNRRMVSYTLRVKASQTELRR